MLTRTSRTSFRRAALGAAAGLSLFTGASLLACYPATAADPVVKDPCAATYERYKKNPNDKTFGDDLGCGIGEIRKERAAAQKGAADARREAEAARKAGAASEQRTNEMRGTAECLQLLTKRIEKGPPDQRQKIIDLAGGREENLFKGDTACRIERQLSQKASASPPLK